MLYNILIYIPHQYISIYYIFMSHIGLKLNLSQVNKLEHVIVSIQYIVINIDIEYITREYDVLRGYYTCIILYYIDI